MTISTPPLVTSAERQSNIELLRILAMVMIVAHHFAVHSGLPIWSGHGANVFWAQFLCMQGKVGVDLFVLITGFFLVEKPGRVTSVLHLLLQTVFYGAVLYLLFVAAGKTGCAPVRRHSHRRVKVPFQQSLASSWYLILESKPRGQT